MLKSKFFLSLLIAVSVLAAAIVFAAAAAKPAATNTYQVTGPILDLSDTMIAVQKGNDRWELSRDASTKVTGDLKVGAKVTIVYKMTATSIEVKPATTAKTHK